MALDNDQIDAMLTDELLYSSDEDEPPCPIPIPDNSNLAFDHYLDDVLDREISSDDSDSDYHPEDDAQGMEILPEPDAEDNIFNQDNSSVSLTTNIPNIALGRGRAQSRGTGRGRGIGRGRGRGRGQPVLPPNPRISPSRIEWVSDPPPPTQTAAYNILRFRDGPARNVRTTNEVSSFDLFMTPEILAEILAQTNRELRRVFHQKGYATPSPFTMEELRACLGLMFLAGVERNWDVPITDLYANDFNPRYSATLARDRLKLFLRFIRFDDKRSRLARQATDRGAAVRYVWELFLEACKKNYVPSETLTIDEQLLPFRGRCQFIQYMPAKPSKYGIKIFWLCDAKTAYAYNGKLYLGKKDEGVEIGLADSVCRELARPVLNAGRNITTDNYFTSVSLAEYLLQHKTTLVGTIKKNRREVPPIMKPDPTREKHSSIFGFYNKITMVSYVPKKNKSVVLISTCHSDTALVELLKKKPEIIIYYNKTKPGVDTMDQMARTYSTKRQTRRWPLTFFFNMLDIAGINSFRIFDNQHPDLNWYKINHCRKIYLRNLVDQLIQPQMIIRSQNVWLRKETRLALELCGMKRTPLGEIAELTPPRKRKRCYLCEIQKDRKSSVTCQKCYSNVCGEHSATFCTECR